MKSGFDIGMGVGILPVVAEHRKTFSCRRPTSFRNRAEKVRRRNRTIS